MAKKKPAGKQSNDATAKQIVCIATGPSLTKEQCEKARSQKTIGINDAYTLAPWVDHLYACDQAWWQAHHSKVVKSVKGKLWTQNQAWQGRIEGLNVIESKHAKGLSTNPKIIHTGSNSGYQAINLAYHLGAERILLLGYDMHGHGNHFFGKHNGPGLSTNTDYSTFIDAYNTIIPEHYGIEIVNCTPNSALDCFPKASIDEFI